MYMLHFVYYTCTCTCTIFLYYTCTCTMFYIIISQYTYVYMLHFLNLLHATCSRMILALPDTLIYHTCISQHVHVQHITLQLFIYTCSERKIRFYS